MRTFLLHSWQGTATRILPLILSQLFFKQWKKVQAKKGTRQYSGGFNPFEKYESKWESSPNSGENKKYLKIFETATQKTIEL